MIRRAVLLIVAMGLLASCTGLPGIIDRAVNWPTDPDAPSWAVDFGVITGINTRAVLNDQRRFWTADRVIEQIGRKALAAVWLDKEKTEFAITYRTDARDYPYCSIIWRWDAAGQVYGYIDFEIHRTFFPLRVQVAKGELIEAGKWMEKQRENRKRNPGI